MRRKVANLGNKIVVCLAVWFMAGCAASTGNAVSSDLCPEPTDRSTEYLIGPGDTLDVKVWRSAELSTLAPVRPDGRITTPLIDDMQAAGKTPSQLSSDMEAVLEEYLRTPEVSVIVKSQGPANQIQVVGEVAVPQSLSFQKGLKLIDVIVAVGGLGEFAAGNRSTLVRTVDDRQVECRVRLKDLMSGDMSQNLNVYQGDVIVVPETRF